jgi:hypothetical protein
MAWVNDLVNVLGVPTSAAMFAVALYAGCLAAEKSARPEALKDIARILKDTSWSTHTRPSALIRRVFEWTFGGRHLSPKCVGRSCVASLVVIVGLGVSMYRRSPAFWVSMQVDHIEGWRAISFLVCLGLIPDYFSLGKTRLILRLLEDRRWDGLLPVVVIVDVAFSILISAIALFLFNAILHNYQSIYWTYHVMESAVVRLPDLFSVFPMRFTTFEVFLVSTFFTSVWTILIVLSTAVLKLLAPSQRFTAWFFNVDSHPLQAIGIVAGTLVMAGAIIWVILRAVLNV